MFRHPAIQFSLPVLVGLAIPVSSRYLAIWLGHPDWRDPLMLGCLIGSVLTAFYLTPSASALRKSMRDSQRATAALLKKLDEN